MHVMYSFLLPLFFPLGFWGEFLTRHRKHKFGQVVMKTVYEKKTLNGGQIYEEEEESQGVQIL
jgi:hypothetical protein